MFMKLNLFKLNLPLNCNFILIKNLNKTNIIIYNNNYYLKFIIKKENIKINKNLNYLEYKNCFLKNNFYILNNYINNFFEKLNKYYFIKINFTGKAYKIRFYKKIKKINFYFGKAHVSIFLYKNTIIKELDKHSFIMLNNNLNKLKNLAVKTVKIKKINFYTGRGLRATRQIIIKRKGRKGSFTKA